MCIFSAHANKLIHWGEGCSYLKVDVCSFIDLHNKMDPKQVFPPTKKHTLNKYLCVFLLPQALTSKYTVPFSSNVSDHAFFYLVFGCEY